MNVTANEFVVVQTTVDGEDKAQDLARRLVEERLAACVQYTSIRSVYRWEGAVESAQEFLLQAKTRADLAGRLTERIQALHDYEVPEIVAIPIVYGSKAYLDWIAKETGDEREETA